MRSYLVFIVLLPVASPRGDILVEIHGFEEKHLFLTQPGTPEASVDTKQMCYMLLQIFAFIQARISPAKKMQSCGISETSDCCPAVRGEGCRAGSVPPPARAQPGGRAEGPAQLCRAQRWLVWTRGPQGTQQRLTDGSERLLNGHGPVGRLVRQNAAVGLPAQTNPLRSPDTRTQTLFTSNRAGKHLPLGWLP